MYRMPTLKRRIMCWGFTPFVAFSLGILLMPLFVVSFWPIVEGFILSFFRGSSVLRPDDEFVKLRNYKDMLSDRIFRTAIVNTFKFSLMVLPMNILLSLPIALGLNTITRFREALRSAYFLPAVTSVVAVSIVWIYLYNPHVGLINTVVEVLGLMPQAWLSDPKWALFSIAVMWVWRDLGYNVVVFLAGLQGIPTYFYEAARIDGANGFQLFRYITVPLLRPVMQFVVIMTAISSFKVFDPIQVMTSGGPMRATTNLVFYVYEHAFEYLKMNQAAAASVVLFGIILLITLLQLFHFRTQWEY